MKKFFELREHAMKIISFEKKKMKLLTNVICKVINSRNLIKMQKFVIFVMTNLKINMLKIKNTAANLGTITLYR